MSCVWRNTVAIAALLFALSAVPTARAANHHELNGTWMLVPDRCDFGGQPSIQSGTVTIWDREHNITVTRTFALCDGDGRSISYTFGMDGQSGATIHEGKSIKHKARWEGNTLVVTTTEERIPTVERFSLGPDGMLVLAVERANLPTMTLLFRRQ